MKRYLCSFGEVSIVCPKWSGKTSTALHHTQSAFYLSSTPDIPDPLTLMWLDPSLIFKGDNPRLIDEWQLMPEIWDMVRGDVDRRDRKDFIF